MSSEPPYDSEPPRRALAYTDEDRRAELLERWRVPILMTTALVLFGASRFDVTRPLEGRVLAVGLPIAVLVAAAAQFRDSSSGVRAFAFTTTALVLGVSELSIAPLVLAHAPPSWAVAATLPSLPLLLALGLLACAVQAAGARRGTRTRYAALCGAVLTSAAYLPGHFDAREPLGSVLAALIVSIFVGGGTGLLCGALVTRIAARR